jgi:hypothetical protein
MAIIEGRWRMVELIGILLLVGVAEMVEQRRLRKRARREGWEQ